MIPNPGIYVKHEYRPIFGKMGTMAEGYTR